MLLAIQVALLMMPLHLLLVSWSGTESHGIVDEAHHTFCLLVGVEDKVGETALSMPARVKRITHILMGNMKNYLCEHVTKYSAEQNICLK